MQRTNFLRLSLSLAVVAGTLCAAEVWNKDPKEWTASDIDRILTSSPWAAKTSASLERGQTDSSNPNAGRSGGMGRGGGMGGMGGGMGGMGGGMGGMGGGGMGGGRRGNGGAPSQQRVDVVVRWDSAEPVKQALLKSQFGSNAPDSAGTGAPSDADKSAGNSDAEKSAGKFDKDYVVSVSGLLMPSSNSYNDSDSSRSSDPDHLRNVLMASTQILVKNKEALSPEDVKIDPQNDGSNTARFFFSRTSPIDLDDKEITFVTQTGHLKIERKFKLKEMVYNGKLSL